MKKLNLLLLALLTLLSMSSCEPRKPEDETKNKLHDDPRTVVMTLTRGQLEGNQFTPQKGVEGEYLKSEQIIRMEVKSGAAFDYVEGSQEQFIVVPHPNVWYLLQIDFLNAEGESINYQYLTNGQEKMHQFFFTRKKDHSSMGGATTEPDTSEKGYGVPRYYAPTTDKVKSKTRIMEYTYLDSIDGKLLGQNEPVGFTGVFDFVEPCVQMDLNVRLYHFLNGTKLDREYGLRPFDSPTKWQRGSNSSGDFERDVPLFILPQKGYKFGTDSNIDTAIQEALKRAFPGKQIDTEKEAKLICE